MKKEKLLKIIPALIVSLTILSINLVSAQNFYIDEIIRGVTDTGAQIFGPIFGHDTADEFLFAKVLLFFLIFAIVFVSLGRIDLFHNNKPVHSILAIIVSIFAVRYIKENGFINAILLPYSALGVAISIFLPLLIYFYFVHYSGIGPFGRRTAWFIYGIVFLVFWSSREYDSIAGQSLNEANWIYLIGIGFIIINLLFDRTIHEYLGLSGLARWRERADDARIARMQAEYDNIRDIESNHAQRRRSQIMRELRRNNAANW